MQLQAIFVAEHAKEVFHLLVSFSSQWLTPLQHLRCKGGNSHHLHRIYKHMLTLLCILCNVCDTKTLRGKTDNLLHQKRLQV